MALPTLAPRLSARRNILEHVIVSKRNKLDNYHDRWSHNSNYFKHNDVRASKLNAWTSEKSFQHSMDVYKGEQDKKIKETTLARRRKALSELFENDRIQQQAELSGLSLENCRQIEGMKERADSLRSAREEKRKEEVAEKLYDHWRLNNPDLRIAESEQHKQHVINKWADQVVENEERLASARKEKEDCERRAELQRQRALKKQEEAETARLKAQKELQLTLKNQMDELRDRELQTQRLKQEEDALIAHQCQLDELERIQKLRQEQQNKRQFGRLLLKQHVAQMKRKSQLVQEELEQDLEMIRLLLARDREDSDLKLEKQKQAKADAAWMKEVLDEQMLLEKAREAEMEMIYQHEAARMWEKREMEWAKERAARQRLMNEVLESRQEQIGYRLEDIQRAQDESLAERERLIEELDRANQISQREQKKQYKAQKERKKELQDQIMSERERKDREQLRLNLEREEEELDEKAEEDLLRAETERMTIAGYTPRDVGRTKQAWL